MGSLGRILYKQLGRRHEAVPSWNVDSCSEKPIWQGLRVKPYSISRSKDIFGVFKQFGIDLIAYSKDIYAQKHRRRVLGIQKLRVTCLLS